MAATLYVWFAHQWREVNDQLLAAITTQDQRAEEATQARADAKVCEEGLTQLRAAIDERRHEITARDGRLLSMQDYVRDLERRAALDAERAKMLTERIEELEEELATLRAEQSAQESARPLPDNTELEQRLASTCEELAQQRARLSSVEQELHGLQRDALENEQSAARARAMTDEMTRRIGEATDAGARLAREHDASVETRRAIIAELAAWAKGYAAILTDRTSVAASIEQAQEARAKAAAALARLRDEQAGIDGEVRGMRSALEAAAIRLELIEAVEVQPQAPDAGVRLILEAGGVMKRETSAPGIELSGVRGLLWKLLRVPPGLERAIEAALSDNLLAIVFDRQSELKVAVDLLLEGDTGRATLYALDGFNESRPLHLMKERGVIGVASALVRCDSRYRRLVDTLLGRTVIVENLAMAQKFVKRGLASAVATTDGVLLRPVGSVSAGTPTITSAAMRHEREVSDLPAEIGRLRPEIEQREAALLESTARLAETQRRNAEIEGTLEELRQRKTRADAALAETRARLARFAARLQAESADARRRDDEIARLAELRGRLDNEREARTKAAIGAEEKEQHARRAIVELEAARGQLSDVIAEHAATVAHLDCGLRVDWQVTGTERAAHTRLARQVDAKDEQRRRLLVEAQVIATRVAAEGRELAAKRGEAEALALDPDPARQELAQFESRERTLSSELLEANGRLRDSERAVLNAEGDVRVRNEELDTLRVSLESEGFEATNDGDVQRLPDPEPAEPPEGEAASGDLPSWLRSEDDVDLPPMRGGSTINPTEIRDQIADLRAQIRALGPVNEQAAADFSENRERYDFLTAQLQDLKEAESQLLDAIDEMERIIRERFRETFKVVNREFERYFNAFFRGGTARLEIGETDDDGLPGVDIIAQPPGKKLGSLALLSGGERSLTAVALLFALLQANPSPICVLDEVDAALDEANVGRFVDELRALSEKTQFVIITHNRRTIETADTIYGVSMGADNVSRILSLKLADVRVE